MTDKKQQGGRREGAGRPAEGEAAKVKTSVAIDPALLQWAAEEAERQGVSRNKVIEDALRARRTGMGGIGMTVCYRSGEMVVRERQGVIEDERRTARGTPEYFVRWADGTSGWFLASNLSFR